MCQLCDKEIINGLPNATVSFQAFDLITKEVKKLGSVELTGSEADLPDQKKLRLSPNILLIANLPILYFEKFSSEQQRAVLKVL